MLTAPYQSTRCATLPFPARAQSPTVPRHSPANSSHAGIHPSLCPQVVPKKPKPVSPLVFDSVEPQGSLCYLWKLYICLLSPCPPVLSVPSLLSAFLILESSSGDGATGTYTESSAHSFEQSSCSLAVQWQAPVVEQLNVNEALVTYLLEASCDILGLLDHLINLLS